MFFQFCGQRQYCIAKDLPLPKIRYTREEIIYDIEPCEKQCERGCEKRKIGGKVNEPLEVIPASIKAIAHTRPKDEPIFFVQVH